MQNNIVYSSEEEALRNAGLNTGVGANVGVQGHLPGQHHHHHAHGTTGVPLVGGTDVLTNQIGGAYTNVPGTVITETQYVSGTTQFVGTGAPLLETGVPMTGGAYTTTGPYTTTGAYNTTGLTGAPLNTGYVQGGNLTGTGLTGVPLNTGYAQGSNLTGTGLLGAGALGAGVAGVGIAGAQHHHHHGVAGTTGTTGLAPATGLGSGIGTVVFRPLEGKFLKDKDPIGKMDCYLKIKIGFHSGKSSVAKSEGAHPIWNDVISLNRKHNEEFAKLKIKDKDRLTLNDKIGDVKIPLNEIAAKGRVKQWFNVYKKDQLAGEILLDIEFQPRTVF